MANTTVSNAARNAGVDAVVDLIDAGGGAGAGMLRIYDGTQPAGPDSIPGATLLAELTLADPAFGDAASGTATANAITADSSANATGTATWFRAVDNNGNGVIDGDVTATGGGGDLELNTTSIESGVEVDVTSWTVTMPAS